MKKQLLNIGQKLTKSEQQKIAGGNIPGSGCWLDVFYMGGGYAMVPYEGNEMLDPFGTIACNAHAQEVYPTLVDSCTLQCTAL